MMQSCTSKQLTNCSLLPAVQTVLIISTFQGTGAELRYGLVIIYGEGGGTKLEGGGANEIVHVRKEEA